MRNAKEVLKDFKYAESLTNACKKYDAVPKIKHNAGTHDCDKFEKKIFVDVSFSMYMGYYGSSSVSSCAPNKSELLNKAVSKYLTEKFNEVMEYCQKEIKNNLKKDIQSIKDEITKNENIIKDIENL